MCTLITGLLITPDEDHCEYRVCGCHFQQWAVMCKLASSTALWRTWGPEARRSHRPVEQEASYSSVCKGQFGHFVKMSNTPMSQHTFSLSYLYTHKCYSSRVISSFCHFHYKHLQSNYDSLGINEQVSTSVQEMLKPFERFWSYGSDWILRETSPECNKLWVVYLGFTVACQLEIPKVRRFRNSAFSPPPVPIWGRRKTNPTQTPSSVLESSELRWTSVEKQMKLSCQVWNEQFFTKFHSNVPCCPSYSVFSSLQS